MHGVMKEFSKYLSNTWGWWLALILIISYWEAAGWWFGFIFIGLHFTDVLFPEKKKGSSASGDSYPYEK